jgi:hypothetical protein
MPIFVLVQGSAGQGATPPAGKATAEAPATPAAPKTTEQLQADIRADAAKIAANAKLLRDQARNGQAGTLVPPVVYRSGNEIPPEAMEMTKMFFTTVVVLALGIPFMRAWIRRFDKRSEAMRLPQPANLEPQLAQLQDSIDALTLEVERIAEGQRFMAKVVADRQEVPASLPGGNRGPNA